MGVALRLVRSVLDARPQLDDLQTDSLQHAFEVVKHLVVCKPEDGESLRRERDRARSVMGELFVGRVRSAVELDDEPCVE